MHSFFLHASNSILPYWKSQQKQHFDLSVFLPSSWTSWARISNTKNYACAFTFLPKKLIALHSLPSHPRTPRQRLMAIYIQTDRRVRTLYIYSYLTYIDIYYDIQKTYGKKYISILYGIVNNRVKILFSCVTGIILSWQQATSTVHIYRSSYKSMLCLVDLEDLSVLSWAHNCKRN